MKLLLDQNLSSRLVQELSALYAESAHVRDIGLHRADDESVWRYAAEHALTLLGLLRTHHPEILAFNEDSEAAFLALG